MKSLLTLAAVLVVSGCNFSGNSDRSIAETRLHPLLQNAQVFKTGCVVNVQEIFQRELQINDREFVHKTETFVGSNCVGDPGSEALASGTYRKGATLADGDVELDVETSSLWVTYNNDEVITYLNQIKFCGFSDWEKGVQRQIAGRECGDDGLYTKKLYTIMHQEGDTLQLGMHDAFHTGLTPAKRHQRLDKTLYKRAN